MVEIISILIINSIANFLTFVILYGMRINTELEKENKELKKEIENLKR